MLSDSIQESNESQKQRKFELVHKKLKGLSRKPTVHKHYHPQIGQIESHARRLRARESVAQLELVGIHACGVDLQLRVLSDRRRL